MDTTCDFVNDKGEKLLLVKVDDNNYVWANEMGMTCHYYLNLITLTWSGGVWRISRLYRPKHRSVRAVRTGPQNQGKCSVPWRI